MDGRLSHGFQGVLIKTVPTARQCILNHRSVNACIVGIN